MKRNLAFINTTLIKDIFFAALSSGYYQIMLGLSYCCALIYLPLEEVGIYSLALGFQALVALVMGAGLRQVVARDYFHLDLSKQQDLIHNCIMTYCAISLCIISLFSLNIAIIKQFFFVPASSNMFIFLSIGAAFVSFFVELLYQVLSYEQNITLLNWVRISSGSIMCTISLIACLIKPTAMGLMIASSSGLLFAAVWSVCYFVLKSFIKFESVFNTKKRFFNLLRDGVGFLPLLGGAWLLQIAQRILIVRFFSVEDVGIYAVTDGFFMLFNCSILVPLGNAYIPYLLKKFSQEPEIHLRWESHNKKIMWLTLIGLTVLLSIGLLLCFFFSAYLPLKYKASIPLVALRIASALFYAGTYFSTIYILFRKKTVFLVFSVLATSLINVILSFMLMRFFGVYGIGLALTISYAGYFFATLKYNAFLHQQCLCCREYKLAAPCASRRIASL